MPPNASAGIQYSGFASRISPTRCNTCPKNAVSAPTMAPRTKAATTRTGCESQCLIFSRIFALALRMTSSFISGLRLL